MTRTFREIAADLHNMELIPAPDGGYIGFRQDLKVVAELADAMDRLERNLAFHFAHMVVDFREPFDARVDDWLANLRAEGK